MYIALCSHDRWFGARKRFHTRCIAHAVVRGLQQMANGDQRCTAQTRLRHPASPPVCTEIAVKLPLLEMVIRGALRRTRLRHPASPPMFTEIAVKLPLLRMMVAF